ncbi:hypothetical protein [Shimia sp. MMG029]|uniref:hypothetical protein n=1 Tax=Shimia sp. MMG029 TaxID=3021978 RepID=UPI0022FE16C8|nr:hypothetical protein [Shimia sp. MMG029]MDA5556255.1 hypothetical protein [Shimia sp. MMG029]
MIKRLSILCLSLAACTDLGDGGFVTAGGTRVNPVNADVFEVIARPRNENNQFWCGAGEYAHRALGASPGANVYVVGGAGAAVTMESPNGAQFSLKPPSQVSGATERDTRWGPRLGQSMFVADARGRCGRDEFDFPF